MYTPLNDISRRDASLAKRKTIFQAYGNIPQVIMIDLARVGSVLNQPAYRQDDSDGPLSGAPMASSSEGGFDAYSCTLNTLHAARVDQMLTPDGMVKIITAEAPQIFIPPEDLETPASARTVRPLIRSPGQTWWPGSRVELARCRRACSRP